MTTHSNTKPIDIDIESIDSSVVQVLKIKGTLSKEALIEFMIRLNINLEVESVFREITQTLQAYVKISSVHFKDTAGQFEINIGQKEKNTFNYRLLDESSNPFGEITLSRDTIFLEEEIDLFEELLCYAMFAIKNSLRYQTAHESSLTDPLTQTGNRRELELALNRVKELMLRHKTPFALVTLDLDNFKKINDQYGHGAGDKLLLEVTNILRNCTRSYDQLFRTGGDEFVIILNQCQTEQAVQSAKMICNQLNEATFKVEKESYQITASLGVVGFSKDDDVTKLLQRADQALYRAKARGKNCVSL